MSFSFRVKEEMMRETAQKHCCGMAELCAFIWLSGSLHKKASGLSLGVEADGEAAAERIYDLLMREVGIDAEVSIKKRRQLNLRDLYLINIEGADSVEKCLKTVGIPKNIFFSGKNISSKTVSKKCCKKAFLRAAFITAGSLSSPEKNNHLEFVLKTEGAAKRLLELLDFFELNARKIIRKGNYVLYLKDGERILDFFALTGAHSTILEIHNLRIVKEVRNNVNRAVNCETANIQKTVDAAMNQIESIHNISSTIGLRKLPPQLFEIAELRLNNPEASLSELGEMLDPPLGRSGVNHRLKKIIDISDKIKKRKGNEI